VAQYNPRNDENHKPLALKNKLLSETGTCERKQPDKPEGTRVKPVSRDKRESYGEDRVMREPFQKRQFTSEKLGGSVAETVEKHRRKPGESTYKIPYKLVKFHFQKNPGLRESIGTWKRAEKKPIPYIVNDRAPHTKLRGGSYQR